MYLGVMGWIGSLLTVRGVTLLSQQRQTTSAPTQEKTISKEAAKEAEEEVKPIPVAEEAKKPETETNKPEPVETQPAKQPSEPQPKPESGSEPKPYEPEIVMLPPKTVEKTIQEKPQTETEQK